MPADAPTIVATSGGLRRGTRSAFELGPLLWHAIERSGATGRPRVCFMGTAGGDQRFALAQFHEACTTAGVTMGFLNVYPMPNVENPLEHLLGHDVVWVGGGSVANLLALWRLHGYDRALEAAWRAGVVLAGVSAGSICWHAGGTTDSFGPVLRAVEGLAFLPYGNGVHYDSEPQRRPFLQRLVAEGALPDSYATDDGVGLVYQESELIEAVTEIAGKGAYLVRREAGTVVEERLPVRLLAGA